MSKKRLYIVIIGLIICLFLICVVVSSNKNANPVIANEENNITRYQWMEMLCKQAGITEYKNEFPYLGDVDVNDNYYSYVQAAVEWGVLEKNTEFRGNDVATGEFIAVTAMKAIGQNKIQIYSESTKSLTDKDYLKFALDEDVIEKAQLKKGFTQDECELVLNRMSELYLSSLWKDDICDIDYQENVVEIADDDIMAINYEHTNVQVSDNTYDSLQLGNVIVYEQPNTGYKYAKRITGKGEDNVVMLEDVELAQVVSSMLLSDVATISAEDILAYYSTNGGTSLSQSNYVNPSDYKARPVFSIQEENKGFAIQVGTEDGELSVDLTDNNTGLTHSLPITEDIENGDVSVTIDISRIDVGAQIIYTEEDGLTYANVQVESDIEVTGEITLNEEKKILLFDSPVLLGSAIAGVDLQFYLVLSMDGSVNIEAELPFQVAVEYEEGVGVRSYSTNKSFDEPSVAASCTAGAFVRAEAILKVFMINIMDVEGDVGAVANAELTTRDKGNLSACLDVSIAAPVLTVSLSGDDDITTLLNLVGISGEWEIVKPEDTFQIGMHFEWDKSGNVKLVEACTYDGKISNIQETLSTDLLKYPMEAISVFFTTPFEDKGDYYVVKGLLCARDYITLEELSQLEPGDTYTVNGHEFIYEGIFSSTEMFADSWQTSPLCKFKDSSGKTYYCSKAGGYGDYQSIRSDGKGNLWEERGNYFTEYWLTEEDGEMRVQLRASIALLDANYTFIVHKAAKASIEKIMLEERSFISIEECFSDSTEDYAGNILTQNIEVPIEIAVDEKGYIINLFPISWLSNVPYMYGTTPFEEWVTRY